MLRGLVVLLTLTLLAASCADEDLTPTSTPTAIASPPAGPTIEATAGSPSPSATPQVEVVAETIWLIDVASGEVRTLVEDLESSSYFASFDGDEVVITSFEDGVGHETRFALDGAEVTAAETDTEAPLCAIVLDGAEVAGEFIEAAFMCIPSPDGRSVTYSVVTHQVEIGSSNYVVDVWDQWLADVASGQHTLLQEGLRHCGGCDGVLGPRWAPDSQALFFAEWGGTPGEPPRLFLATVEGPSTSVLLEEPRGSSAESAPIWSADGSALLFARDAQSVVLLDPTTRAETELPTLEAPARFDSSGAYAYSPAWFTPTPGQPQSPPETTVVELASGEVVATLPGASAADRYWGGSALGPAVAVTEDGIVAALEHVQGCGGTVIYAPAGPLPCISGGAGAELSPDTSRIALARRTGITGHVRGPDMEATSLGRWEVLAVDVATGDVRTLAERAVSDSAPAIRWNADSTHILVRWPHRVGF